MKLSAAQLKAINSMVGKDWSSSYELQVALPTLNALEKKGLVKSKGKGKPGAHYCPRTIISWKLTEQEQP